jgi:hypothetical protein
LRSRGFLGDKSIFVFLPAIQLSQVSQKGKIELTHLDPAPFAGAYPFSSGDPDRIIFLGEVGRRQRVAIDADVVELGTAVYVGTNAWAITEKAITRVL